MSLPPLGLYINVNRKRYDENTGKNRLAFFMANRMATVVGHFVQDQCLMPLVLELSIENSFEKELLHLRRPCVQFDRCLT